MLSNAFFRMDYTHGAFLFQPISCLNNDFVFEPKYGYLWNLKIRKDCIGFQLFIRQNIKFILAFNLVLLNAYQKAGTVLIHFWTEVVGTLYSDPNPERKYRFL